MLNLEDRIVVALRRITQAMDCRSHELHSKHGLTAPQCAVLPAIMARNGATNNEISDAVSLRQATITGMLSRLERRGLLRHERSLSDRRQVLWWTTDEGRKLFNTSPAYLRDAFLHDLMRLPFDKRRCVVDTLQLVAKMMHAPEDTP